MEKGSSEYSISGHMRDQGIWASGGYKNWIINRGMNAVKRH
jgi:hypothetical protein